jgi:hypothetical protein
VSKEVDGVRDTLAHATPLAFEALPPTRPRKRKYLKHHLPPLPHNYSSLHKSKASNAQQQKLYIKYDEKKKRGKKFEVKLLLTRNHFSIV